MDDIASKAKGREEAVGCAGCSGSGDGFTAGVYLDAWCLPDGEDPVVNAGIATVGSIFDKASGYTARLITQYGIVAAAVATAGKMVRCLCRLPVRRQEAPASSASAYR